MEWLLLALSLALMVACGLFVAAEFSFVTVDRSAIERAARSGDRKAQGTQAALQSLSTQLSGAQLGITITNLAIGFLAEPALAQLLRGPLSDLGVSADAIPGIAVTLGLAISTVLTMLLGELVPKNLAIALPLATARATQGFMRGFTRSMAVPIRVLNGSANWIVRRLGIEPQEELRSARSPDELVSLVRRSALEGVLDRPSARMLVRSLDFGDRLAGEVATPRTQVRFVDGDNSVSDVIQLSRTTGFSRFPVMHQSADEVTGVVHIKQAVAIPVDERGTLPVERIATGVPFVPDTMELDQLLVVLRNERLQMAVVLDEYGGTHGVVTLEDLIEEIVGAIADEHDRPSEEEAHRHADGSWSISGLLRPDEVRLVTGVPVAESENSETIAGIMLEDLGRMPRVGDVAIVPLASSPLLDPSHAEAPTEVQLTVERLDGRRIDRLRLRVRPATDGGTRDG